MCTATTSAVTYEIYVKGFTDLAGNKSLQKILRWLSVHPCRQETNSVEYPVAMAVDREYIAAEGVKQNAPRDFWSDAREGSERCLRVLGCHVTQRSESYSTEPRAELFELRAKTLQLHACHSIRLKHAQSVRVLRVQESIPRAPDQPSE